MIRIRQPNSIEIDNLKIDFLISSSGFETRAIAQSKTLATKATYKVALAFNSEMDDPVRKYNDEFFTQLGFALIGINSEERTNSQLEEIIHKIELRLSEKDETIVYIDYSSMTKNW